MKTTLMNAHIHIVSDVDERLNPRRGVQISVTTGKQVTRDDVIQLLKAHGFDAGKLLEGLTRTTFGFEVNAQDTHYQIFISENIPFTPPKPTKVIGPKEDVKETTDGP